GASTGRARQLGGAGADRHTASHRPLARAGLLVHAAGATALDTGGDCLRGRLPGLGRGVVLHRLSAVPERGDGDMRVALVTGAGGGIGRATADLLERRGWEVARNDLPGVGVAGHAWPADVSDPDAVNALVRSVSDRLGPVSLLVSNAAHMV